MKNEPDSRQRPAWRGASILLICACSLLALSIFKHSFSGDAAVYFTYFKRFYGTPFAFQEGTVSHGASSPLHVILGATFFELFPGHWHLLVQLMNLAALTLGLILLRGTLRSGVWVDCIFMALALGIYPLWESSFQLYETSLAFLACSALYRSMLLGQRRGALWIMSVLCLLRPELVLVVMAAGAWLGKRMSWGLTYWRALSLLLAPSVLYYTYMAAMTGHWVPSNILARGLSAAEYADGWWDSSVGAARSLRGQSKLMFLGLCLLPCATLWRRSFRTLVPEWILIGPLVGLYLLFPPAGYLARYLLPVCGVLLVLLTRLLIAGAQRLATDKFRFQGIGRIGAYALLPLSLGLAAHSRPTPARYDLDTLLLRDLGKRLQAFAAPGQRVLIYEMQGQFHIDAHCISMDGIVGHHMHAALSGKESFEDAIVAHGIDFVVTMNAMNYRKVFDDTSMEHLYQHDLSHPVGESLMLGSLRLEKISSNAVFDKEGSYELKAHANLNTGTELRVFGSQYPAWAGHHPLWNSIYRVDDGG